MKGTGRVANLLADLHSVVVSSDAEQHSRPYIVSGAAKLSDLVLDTVSLQKFVVIKHIVEEMGMRNLAESPGRVPASARGPAPNDEDRWKRWKKLFRMYDVMTEADLTKAEVVASLRELKEDLTYLAGMSGWIFVFDVDSIAVEDAGEERMTLTDAAAHCVHDLKRQTGPARVWLEMWRRMNRVPKTGGDGKGSEAADANRLQQGVKFIRKKIEEFFRRDEVLLLVQWDRRRMLHDLLEYARESGLPLGRELLEEGLHTALKLGRCVAAKMLFDGGADVSLYQDIALAYVAAGKDQDNSRTKVGKTQDYTKIEQPWTDLMQAISCDRIRAKYLGELSKKSGAHTQSEGDSDTRKKLKDMYSKVLEFTYSEDGMSTDFRLFMLMLLANRQDMARLFWQREAKERPASALHSALVACVLCRNLSRALDRGSALDSLLQTAEWYEAVAVRILARVHSESAEMALQWMVHPNPAENFAPGLAGIDLVVKGRCQKLIEECSDLCIDAVQIVFSGDDEIFCAADDAVTWFISLLPGPWSGFLRGARSESYRYGSRTYHSGPHGWHVRTVVPC